MASPISDHELVAYAAGELAGAHAGRVEEFLEAEPGARATVARYRAAWQAIRDDGSLATPEHVIARAKAMFQTGSRAGARWDAWIGQAGAILAHVVYDSRAQPLLVRASGGSERFAAVWETEAAEIEIEASLADLARSPGGARRWRVVGQVTSPGALHPIAVALVHAGTRDPVAETTADQAGRFRVEAPAARYDLLVKIGDSAVFTARLDLDRV